MATSTTIKGTFTSDIPTPVDLVSDKPVPNKRGTVSHNYQFTSTNKEDMDCFAAATYLYVEDPVKTTQYIIGQIVFTGTLHGKKGGFAANDTGICTGDKLSGSFEIIPETASDELVGITGKGSYAVVEGKFMDPIPFELSVVMP